jgi:hypothetical protein
VLSEAGRGPAADLSGVGQAAPAAKGHECLAAAQSLGRTQTALGAFFGRLAFRIGKAKAITATARKLAILVCRTLKGDIVYVFHPRMRRQA